MGMKCDKFFSQVHHCDSAIDFYSNIIVDSGTMHSTVFEWKQSNR